MGRALYIEARYPPTERCPLCPLIPAALHNPSNASVSFLLTRLKVLKENQEIGEIKAPDIKLDNRDFGIGAQILHDLNISKLKLITNSKQTKRVGMIGYGLEIVDYVTY